MSICELSLEVLQMANFSQITHSPTFGRASNQPVEKHRVRVRPWAPSLRWNEDIQTFLVHILHVQTAEYVHSVALTLECGHSMAKLSNSYFDFFLI